MPTEREHRMIQLDDTPFEDDVDEPAPVQHEWPPENGQIMERVRRNRIRDDNLRQLMMQHVVQAGAINCNTAFMRRLQPGHEVILVKERRIVTIVRRFEQQPRQRDWGKIRFEENGETYEWIISDRGKGLDGHQLMLPVMRLYQLLESIQQRAEEMADSQVHYAREALRDLDMQIIRDLNAAMQYDGEAQPGGITRDDLAAARDLGSARSPH